MYKNPGTQDLDDVAGSDYQPSPVPASEVYATDDELDLADEEEEEQEEEVPAAGLATPGSVCHNIVDIAHNHTQRFLYAHRRYLEWPSFARVPFAQQGTPLRQWPHAAP